MLTAVIWDTDNSGKQVEACRLRTEDGRVRPSSLNPSGLFVLNRPLYDERGRKLTKQDGDDFLRLMPAAYSGTRTRVELIQQAGEKESPSDTKQLIQPMLRPPQPNVWEDSPRQQQPVVNINLVVPPEAIRVVIDQVAPIVHVNVPEQKPPDVVVNLPEIRFPEIPAPVVNVEVPRQQRPVVNIDVPEQPAPVVNVDAPVVNVMPNIDVIVPPKQKPRKATITHADGTVSEIEVE